MTESLARFAQIIDDTFRGGGFDVKFLGDYINKPGDADFLFIDVQVATGDLIVSCSGDIAIVIASPTDVSASAGTVRIFDAAKIELRREHVLGSVATEGDEIVIRFPPNDVRRAPRDAVLTPLAELVYVRPRPEVMREPHRMDMTGVVWLGDPPAEESAD